MTWPDGHFYSPVPSDADLARSQQWREAWVPEATPGIRISPSAMLAAAQELAAAVGEFRLVETPGSGRRYGWSNGQFNAGDAGLLTAVIALMRPKRVLEVGAGYSTACMLDAIDAFATGTRVTSIEPYPQRLRQLVDVESTPNLALVEAPVQDFPLEGLAELAPGDIVFIDSSHVAKAGSDVLFEVFEIVPRIPPGVWVHFHDILHGFEYPRKWQDEGRYWTESYLLRALLIGNAGLQVRMWPACLTLRDRAALLRRMPVMENRIGGSLWLEVVTSA